MRETESIPFAPALVESMRSIGYSFETAIADLLDNSISAKATKININLYSDDEPYLVVLDNGFGMEKKELEDAMRYGSSNPLDKRNTSDLGRFGLGMKSASLSQCRRLSVISKKNSQLSCYVWDIDHIIKRGKWALIELDESNAELHHKHELLEDLQSGTMIIMEKFDRVKRTTGNLYKTLNDMLVKTIDHISLVFHSFLEDGIEINVNNNSLIPRDPFLSNHKSVTMRRKQTFFIDGEPIVVKPYILPHINKLTHKDIVSIGGKDALRSEQGFYIYRNKRLIIWGTWFNLERKHELNKLARVRVDIPNSLDYVWSIDIKKSTARLPDKIKHNLHNAVYETVQVSEKIHNYRGRKYKSDNDIQYIWQRIKTRTGFSYRINRELPELKILSQELKGDQYDTLNKFLKLIEETVPASNMYLDVAKGVFENEISIKTKEAFEDIRQKSDKAVLLNMNPKDFLKTYIYTEPYCNDVDLIELIKEELVKYD